jgi:hypothetical protein
MAASEITWSARRGRPLSTTGVERAAHLAGRQTLGDRLLRHPQPCDLEPRSGHGCADDIEVSGSLDYPRQQKALDACGRVDRRDSRECLFSDACALGVVVRFRMEIRELSVDHRCGDAARLKQCKAFETDRRLAGAAGT